MARSGGLLGGGGGSPLDLYGDLFTDEQKQALQQRELSQGLLRFAEKLGAASAPSPVPKSGFLGLLGQSLGAFGGDEAANKQLEAMALSEKVRASQQTRALNAKIAPAIQAVAAAGMDPSSPAGRAAIAALLGQTPGATPAAPAAPGAPAGGAPASNAPPPPPGGLPSDIGNIAGPASWATQPPPVSAGGLPGLPPGAQSSLLPPPPGANPQMGGTLSADLYGGAAPGTLPFDLASARPTGDNPGSLPDLGQIQVELLSGEARPAGDPRGLVPYIRQKAISLGIDPDVAVRVARSEGLGTFQSNVIQKSGQREPSFGAFQLYTGGGMGNDFQRDTGLDPSDPKNELKTIDYALENAPRTGWTPWHGAKGAGIGPRTGLPGGPAAGTQMARGNLPDVGGVRVEPLGGEAAPAGAGGYIPGLGMTPQGLAALNALTKMGGLGEPFGSLLESYYKSPNYITEAARARAAGENDPLVIEQKKRTEYKIDTELKPKLEAAVAWAMNAPLKDRANAEAEIARRTKELEQLGAAGTKIEEATVAGDDGKPIQKKMTALEIAIREKLAAERRANKDYTVRPGDIIGTPVLSPGETETQQQQARAPYAAGDMTLTWPDGEERKVPVTGQQRKDILEGKPVPALGWPGTAAGSAASGAASAVPAGSGARVGEAVYPPGHAEATTVLLKERRPKAEAAVQSLQFNDVAKQLLDAGIITGTGAGLRLDAAKAASLFGWDSEKIAATESFLATQARQVASVLGSGAFGSGASITDEDRRQVASMVGANANLDEKSLRFLVRLNETAANWEIDRYSKDVDKHDPKNRLPILRVDRPPKAETKAPVNNMSAEAAQARSAAAAAIAKGAPKDAVLKRLRDAGIDTGGL